MGLLLYLKLNGLLAQRIWRKQLSPYISSSISFTVTIISAILMLWLFTILSWRNTSQKETLHFGKIDLTTIRRNGKTFSISLAFPHCNPPIIVQTPTKWRHQEMLNIQGKTRARHLAVYLKKTLLNVDYSLNSYPFMYRYNRKRNKYSLHKKRRSWLSWPRTPPGLSLIHISEPTRP